MPGGLRGVSVVLAAMVAAASGLPLRALAGPCPREVPGGCRGFLTGKHLALTAVLGSGVDAASLEAVGVTPDGKTGYGLRVDGALDAWDLGTGVLRRVEIARFIALDPAGRWAVASQPRKGIPDSMWSERGSGLELWDLASRRRVATAKVEWEDPLSFEFSRRRILVQGALGDSDETVVLDAATGKVRRARGTFCPGAAALTPDGTHAVCTRSGGDGDDDDDDGDGEGDGGSGVVLWDLDRMKIARRMPARAIKDLGSVAGVTVSPDGGRALVAFSRRRHGAETSVIWNLGSGKIDKGPGFGDGRGIVLRWAPAAGRTIWIGSARDPGVSLEPVALRDARKTTWLGDREDRVRDAVVLPDGKRLLTGTIDRGVMRLVALADGRALRASREVTGHLGEVLSLSISRDGNRLLSCGKDHTARLWDLQSNRSLRSIPLDKNDNPIAEMTPDGAFAMASLKGLTLVELPEGKPRLVLGGDRRASLLAIAPDGTQVLVRAPFGTTLWEIPSGREIWSQNPLGGAAVFSADQRRIYGGVEHKSIISVIDAGSGVVKASFGKTGPTGQTPTDTLALAPREDFFIMHGGIDDRAFWGPGEYDLVARFDVPAGRFAWTIQSRQYVRQLALSPDGRWFVVAGAMHWGGDKADPMKPFPARVELRATADGAVVDALDLDSAGLVPFAAAFTPDGRTLMVGTQEGPILRFAVTP